MKRLLLGVALLSVFFVCQSAMAQDPKLVTKAAPTTPNLDNTVQTESMWFYLQELRRYEDPKTVIRRRAERKAEERRDRLAAQKWYGYSAGRPLANPTPFTGTYSQMWVGNGKDALQWVGTGYATTALRLDLTKKAR